MRTTKTILVAAAIALLLCGATSAKTPGTCPGMALGQLAGLNGFVPFQGTSSLWNGDISDAAGLPIFPGLAR